MREDWILYYCLVYYAIIAIMQSLYQFFVLLSGLLCIHYNVKILVNHKLAVRCGAKTDTAKISFSTGCTCINVTQYTKYKSLGPPKNPLNFKLPWVCLSAWLTLSLFLERIEYPLSADTSTPRVTGVVVCRLWLNSEWRFIACWQSNISGIIKYCAPTEVVVASQAALDLF